MISEERNIESTEFTSLKHDTVSKIDKEQKVELIKKDKSDKHCCDSWTTVR